MEGGDCDGSVSMLDSSGDKVVKGRYFCGSHAGIEMLYWCYVAICSVMFYCIARRSSSGDLGESCYCLLFLCDNAVTTISGTVSSNECMQVK